MNSSSPVRKLLIVATALFTVALAIWFIPTLSNKTSMPSYDFLEYWAAGRLTIEGQNPYNSDLLFSLQQEIGTDWADKEVAIMMWNPPWALPLVMLLGSVSASMAQIIWFLINLAAVLISADLSWQMFGGPPQRRWLSWIIAITFAPTGILLFFGQITGLILFGLVGFCYLMHKQKPHWAGACSALTALKPHFLAIFALLYALEAIRNKQARRAALVGLAVLVVCSLIPLIWVPNVWKDYFSASEQNSATFVSFDRWIHPTIGYKLRQLFPGQPFSVQFIPLILTMPLVSLYWWRQRHSWSWAKELHWIPLVCALTVCYGGWFFDLVILLPSVIWIWVRLIESKRRELILLFSTIYFPLNIWAFLDNPLSQNILWTSPLVLAGMLLISFIIPSQDPKNQAKDI